MGSLWSKFSSCLKSSTHEGGHTVLGSNTVGGPESEPEGSNRLSPSEAAAQAAECRATKRAQERTRGDLGKKLEAQKGRRPSPEGPERVVWD